MEVDAAIRARRTHKQYGAEPLDEAVVRELVDLARLAPKKEQRSSAAVMPSWYVDQREAG